MSYAISSKYTQLVMIVLQAKKRLANNFHILYIKVVAFQYNLAHDQIAQHRYSNSPSARAYSGRERAIVGRVYCHYLADTDGMGALRWTNASRRSWIHEGSRIRSLARSICSTREIMIHRTTKRGTQSTGQPLDLASILHFPARLTATERDFTFARV